MLGDRSIDWDGAALIAVDQRALPGELRTLRLTTVDQVVEAIRTLAIRGAPAIGVAGAFAVALSALDHAKSNADTDGGVEAVLRDVRRIAAARPTAVNLSWAVNRVAAYAARGPQAVVAAALSLLEADEAVNRAAAARAADLVATLVPRRPIRVLTHCNTGSLATVAWGTALGAIRDLHAHGLLGDVLAGETRPLLQGSRLTAWELARDGIPFRLCVDGAGPGAIARGLVDCVIVGADRVTRNGDVANKIGTYPLALAAARAAIPFVVVAPESTVDETLAHGGEVTIEERDPAEIQDFAGRRVAPQGTAAYNPAFDVTPADLVTAVVTERRILQPGLVPSVEGHW